MKRQIPQRLREHAPLLLGCAAMIGLGLWLRGRHFDHPAGFMWDEHHFVLNAKNYLEGRPDLNDHPPLGKLMMALPIWLFGDSSGAWRSASLFWGVMLISSGALLGRRLLRSNVAGVITAALLAVDGLLIAYSRAALLDGMLASLCLLAVYVAVAWRGPWGLFCSAVVLGSACAVKFSALVFVVPLGGIALSRRQWAALPALLAIPVAYYAWFALGLSLTAKPWGPAGVIAETVRLYQHHAGLNHWTHPLLTRWYEWFLPVRPVVMHFEIAPGGRVRALSSLGNIALWWAVNAAVLLSLGTLVRHGFVRVRRWRQNALVTPPLLPPLLLLCFALPILPWTVSDRDSYLNHYLPAYVFGVVLAAAAVTRLYQNARALALVGVFTIGRVGAYYAPLWSHGAITHQGFQSRLPFKTWR